MEVNLADERAFILQAQLSVDQAEGRAWGHKVDAFGTVAKMGSLLQRPKDDDFKLLYKEQRYEPFWHVVCDARYIYERCGDYPLAFNDPAVRSVTIDAVEYQVSNGKIVLTGLEHCREELHANVFCDGLTSTRNPALADYIQYAAVEIAGDDLDDFSASDAVVVPPAARASAIVHEVLIEMIKSVKAERILEDCIDVAQIDLYYRPVYAFQYRWLSKKKETIVEYDGLTGQWQVGGKTFQQYIGKILDPDFLFDVGVETVDLLVPGGGLAIKLAKKSLDVAYGSKPEG
ncbi:MAG TPA: hypothetical protein PLH19_09055 [Anaerolineae bacterium]|nr:hypothetical protein [Anaerolineae bacterium]HQH38664.1 hypothetical protein [Anaerolineae bacterium]